MATVTVTDTGQECNGSQEKLNVVQPNQKKGRVRQRKAEVRSERPGFLFSWLEQQSTFLDTIGSGTGFDDLISCLGRLGCLYVHGAEKERMGRKGVGISGIHRKAVHDRGICAFRPERSSHRSLRLDRDHPHRRAGGSRESRCTSSPSTYPLASQHR